MQPGHASAGNRVCGSSASSRSTACFHPFTNPFLITLSRWGFACSLLILAIAGQRNTLRMMLSLSMANGQTHTVLYRIAAPSPGRYFPSSIYPCSSGKARVRSDRPDTARAPNLGLSLASRHGQSRCSPLKHISARLLAFQDPARMLAFLYQGERWRAILAVARHDPLDRG